MIKLELPVVSTPITYYNYKCLLNHTDVFGKQPFAGAN